MRPDAQLCGSQGHVFTVTVSASASGTALMHMLFGVAEDYSLDYSGPEPEIGAVGETVTMEAAFDGWGYVHLFDAVTGAELDTYGIDEAHDEEMAFGSGDFTVHEVATDPQDASLMYISYYSGGMRVVQIQCGGTPYDPESPPANTTACELVELRRIPRSDRQRLLGRGGLRRRRRPYLRARKRHGQRTLGLCRPVAGIGATGRATARPARSSGPHGWVALRRLVLAVCLPLAMLLLLASAPVAEAVERRANDMKPASAFTLDGRALAVRLLSRAPQACAGSSLATASARSAGRTSPLTGASRSGARGCGR